jgi:hypothetical protein
MSPSNSPDLLERSVCSFGNVRQWFQFRRFADQDYTQHICDHTPELQLSSLKSSGFASSATIVDG